MIGRLVFYVGYLGIVCLLAYVVGSQSASRSGPHSVAASDMPANHQLQPQDLLPIDRPELVGQFLRRRVWEGQVITSESVTAKPVLTTGSNMIAAIIAVPKSTIMQLTVREGMQVQICHHGQPFGGPAEVVVLSCSDARSCSVTLRLPKIAGRTIDPDALTDATLASASGQAHCEAHP